MPPKGKDKGGVKAKQGSQLKDILPPNAKQPREGEPFEQIEEPAEEGVQKQDRHYEYLPYTDYPAWPGNLEVQELFDKELAEIDRPAEGNAPAEADDQVSDNEDQKHIPEDKMFTDEFEYFMPPSFNEFERKRIKWLRPSEYISEIANEKEDKKNRSDKKSSVNRRRKTSKRMRKVSISSIGDETSGVAKVSSHKKKSKKFTINYKVIGYQERPETEDEMRRRKEEEEKIAGKDKKKPPKKGQEEEEQPQMVRVAIESNMDMGFFMPSYSKWLTSQLQFIKDRTVRDTKTKEPIWKRIFPQDNGIPMKSPTGKYRVKMRFMGQERLVVVDDRMPCDIKKKLMYPRTTDFTEIWPQLLIKAFFKLYSFKWYPGAQYDRETGDGSLVYALTGLIGERIKIDDFHKDGIELLRKHLSDDHYFNNKTYVMAYCGPTFRPKLPSQIKDTHGEFPGSKGTSPNQSISGPSLMINNLANTQKQKLAMRLREIASLALSITSGKKLNINSLNKARPSYVIPGFGYALMDMFENKEVDMDTIARKPSRDDVKSPFMSPSRAERRAKSRNSPMMSRADSISKKRKKKRKGSPGNKKGLGATIINVKKAPPIQYKLIKIKTSVGNYPILNVNPPFTNTEIKMAKKCILNGWTQPPGYEEEKKEHVGKGKTQKDFKIEMSPVKEEHHPDSKEENKEGEGEGDEAKKPIEYEPRTRAPGGIWLQAGDFPFCFQYFIVYHNDEKIANRKIHKDIWTNPSKPYKVNEQNIYIRIRDPTEEELKEQQAQKEETSPDGSDKYQNIEKNIKKDDKKRILVAFSPNATLKFADKLPRYYCRISEEITHSTQDEEGANKSNNIVLSNLTDEENINEYLFPHYFSGQMLKFDNKPKLILNPHIYAPLGYSLWLASESKIEIITHTQLCVEEQGLFAKNYQIEQFNILKGKYTLLFKFDFKPTEADTECMFSLKTEDKYLYDFMRLKIVDKAGVDMDPDDSSKLLSLSKKLVEATSITTLNAVKTEKITFQPNEGKGYSIICEAMVPYDIFALNMNLEMISNREGLELEKIEMVEPLIYTDVYVPYKYGIIFKEKIYVGPHTSAAFNITILQKRTVKKEKPKVEGEDNKENEDGKQEENQEVETVKSELHKNFKVEIFDKGDLIATYNGNGHITISHFNFRSNNGLEEKPKPAQANGEVDAPPADVDEDKEYKHHYVIQATFDKNDWPDCTNKEIDATKDISWEMRVFSSDTVAIVRDTDKEDREKALKESWETAEPGRAEKSHKSRVRYLAQVKQENGEELTEEEKEVLKEKRVRGGNNLKEVVPDPKAAKGKGDKKGAPVEEDDKKEEAPITYPQSTDYTNLHFREFIHHFEGDRLIHVKCDKSAARLRNEREIEERQKEREDEVASWENVFNTRLQNRESEQKDRQEKQKITLDILMKSRKDFIAKNKELFEKRGQYRDMISNRKYKEILLTDILNAEKIEIAALEQALQEAKDALVKRESLDAATRKLETLKYSKGIEEELQAASAEKNAEKMREIIEKIEKENLIVEPKVLNDAKNVLSKIK